MFDHKKHNIIRPFAKEDHDETGHYYITNDGNRYPSITTIFKKFPEPEGLTYWKRNTPNWKQLSDSSMKVGTEMHRLAEYYLNNDEVKLKEDEEGYEKDPMELFYPLADYLDKHVNNIHGTEMKMYHDEMGLAGTVDLICEHDGELTVIDFKNSRKPKTPSAIKSTNYYIQGCAYSEMFKYCTNIDVENIIILVVSWDNKVRPFKIKKADYINKLWDKLIDYELLDA